MSTSNNTHTLTGEARIAIVHAAEKLYALHGIDAVSTRQISREAGQKNHSAVQYHFGSAEGLLNAILDHRMGPLNKRREQLLDAWELSAEKGKEQQGDVRALVRIMAEPLLDQLQGPVEEGYYMGLLMQLSTRGYFAQSLNSHRSQALWRVHEHLSAALSHLDHEVALQRQVMMGRQLVISIADWDRERRQSPLVLSDEQLARRNALLFDFIVGGLCAPASTAE